MYPSRTSRRNFLAGCILIPISPFFQASKISEKTVNKRNSSEIGEYAIGFASKKSGGGYDHAFVIWYYSDPQGNQTVRRCAGFYPVSNDSTKSYDMILGVKGKVLDDSKVKIDRELTVLINKDVFDQAISVEDRYKDRHTYHLAFDDCTTFVQKVAASIRGLSIPNRLTHIYPSDFISSLYDSN